MNTLLAISLGVVGLSQSPKTTMVGNAYTLEVQGRKQSYQAILAPGMNSTFFTRTPKGYKDTVNVFGREIDVSATLVDEKERAYFEVDLFLGIDILKHFVVKGHPFRRQIQLLPRSQLASQARGMVLLEGPRGNNRAESEALNIEAMRGFTMYYVLELPIVGGGAFDVETVTNTLGFETGRQVVYHTPEKEVAFAGFADNHFQTMIYDFRSGALYGAEPVPNFVPILFSIVRQPMEFKNGRLFLIGKSVSPIVEVEGAPLAIFAGFLSGESVREIFQRGYLDSLTADGRDLKIRVPPSAGWIKKDPQTTSGQKAKADLFN